MYNVKSEISIMDVYIINIVFWSNLGSCWLDFAYILLLFRKKKEIYNNKKRECTGNTYFIFYSWICYYTVFFIDGGLASDRTQEIFEATGVITDKTYMLTNKKGLEGKNIINPDFEINELITPLAFLPFFQILSYQITEDTHKWKKHPLMDEMKRLAGAKTLNYESSPLRKDMPQ